MVCLGFKEIWISFNMIVDTHNRCWFWQAAGIVDRTDILLVNVPNQWHAESVTSRDTKLWSARVRQRRTLQPLILILYSSPLSKCITLFLIIITRHYCWPILKFHCKYHLSSFILFYYCVFSSSHPNESLLQDFIHWSSFNVCAFLFWIKNTILT